MMTSSRFLRFACTATLFLSMAAPALAQAEERGRMMISIGPGAYFGPKFPGAKELELRPWPNIDIYREGSESAFETPDEGFGFSLIGTDGLQFGPTLQMQSGRDEEEAIVGIGDVKRTVEVGAFVQSYFTPNFRLRGEVRKGISGHKGVVADLGADFIGGSRESLQVSVGPRLRLANRRYIDAFFGVDAGQAARTGLAAFDVDGGVASAGALAFARYKLSNRWIAQAYSRYDRLLGDAGRSPIVRSSVGSRDQFEVGLGIAYSFVSPF